MKIRSRHIEERMAKQGYLDAASMATTFNLLRANDLIWSFVINNYLLGKEPFPFDILYWNTDSTNLPAAMHSFYLRKMYMENLLCEPNGLEMNGAPLDLTYHNDAEFPARHARRPYRAVAFDLCRDANL